jgi:hypothetical protein
MTATEIQTLTKTPEDKATIAEYVKSLKEHGFCKIDDSASQQTRLFNRFTGDLLHASFLENDFVRWAYENKKEVEFPSASYIMRTLDHVVGQKFDPSGGVYSTEPRSRLRYVNTYQRYEPSGTNKELSPLWFEFWERLIVDPVQRHQALQWLAHAFQFPSERPSYHLMWPSEPGTGKGYLFENVLHPLLRHTDVINSYAKLTDRFSTVLETSLMVLLDDCKTSSEATQTKLKSILSEERQYIEKKQQQGKMVSSYTRFILASNEVRPLFLDADERRWLVFDRLVHKVDGAETQEFITRLDSWLKLPGSLDAVFHWFMTYDLTGFNHKRAPQSEALKMMVALSKNPHEEFAADYAKDHVIFTLTELQEAFKDAGLSAAKASHVPHFMSRLGYAKAQLKFANEPRSVYWFPVGMPRDQVQRFRKRCAREVQGAKF